MRAGNSQLRRRRHAVVHGPASGPPFGAVPSRFGLCRSVGRSLTAYSELGASTGESDALYNFRYRWVTDLARTCEFRHWRRGSSAGVSGRGYRAAMTLEYEAIDLTPFVNADDDIEMPGIEAWRGRSVLRGLPFVFAERDGQTRLLRVAPGHSVTVPVASGPVPVRTVTFAHRTRDGVAARFAPVGRENAVYTFVFSDGATCGRPDPRGVRGRECARREWGHRPSLAVPDQSDSLAGPGAWRLRGCGLPADGGRRGGPVGSVGRAGRVALLPVVVGQSPPGARSGPDRDRGDERQWSRSAACAWGFADEHPLQPGPARAVVADPPADYSGDGSDLALEVDRGTVRLHDTAGQAAGRRVIRSRRGEMRPAPRWPASTPGCPRLARARYACSRAGSRWRRHDGRTCARTSRPGWPGCG